MFGEMRRFKQQLSKDEVERILRENTSGVLAVIDGDGYPYTVPLSYVYESGKIYFHSAKEGRKVSAVKSCAKATFCVIDRDDVQPEKYTTFYKSVVAFGRAEILESGDESLRAITLLGEKYDPEHKGDLRREIEKYKDKFLIIKFEIEYMTGKCAKAIT